jgi:hypothetical protein
VTDELEEQVRSSFARRAGQLSPRTVSADLVIARARRAARVRHATQLVVSMAVVAALALAGLDVLRWTALPVPPGPSLTTTPVPVRSLGLTLLSGRTVQLPDGSRVVLHLPPDVTATLVRRAAGGWLVSDNGAMWWSPDTGAAQPVQQVVGDRNAMISADGSRLIIDDASGLSTYRLPDMHLEKRISPSSPSYPRIPAAPTVPWEALIGLAGDVALIQVSGSTSSGAETAIAWNFVRGTAVLSGLASVHILAVSPGGTVLRRTGPDGTATPGGGRGQVTPDGAECIRTVGIDEALAPVPGGVCGPAAVGLDEAVISPDSDWIMARATDAAIPVGEAPSPPPVYFMSAYPLSRYVLIRTNALDAGSYDPVLLPADVNRIYGWISPNSVLVSRSVSRSVDVQNATKLYVCGLDATCAPVALPSDLPNAVPMLPPLPSP